MVRSRVQVKELTALKKRRRILRLSIFGFILVLITVASIYCLTSDKFEIKEIKIIGLETLKEKDIRSIATNNLEGKYYYVFPKSNIVSFPRDLIIEELKNHSAKIKHVDVYRDSLNSIKISIEERTPEYMWCEEDDDIRNCLFADETGFIYVDAPNFSDPVYLEFSNGDQGKGIGTYILPTTNFLRVVDFVELLKEINVETREVVIVDDDDIFILTRNGWELKFRLDSDFNALVRNLNASLQSEALSPARIESEGGLLYIDMRFEGKVYSKFRNQE